MEKIELDLFALLIEPILWLSKHIDSPLLLLILSNLTLRRLSPDQQQQLLLHLDLATLPPQIQRDLQKTYQYLGTLLSNFPVGVAILEGADFRYFRINGALAKLNGLPVEEHIGQPLLKILPHAEGHILPELRRVRATGEPILGREFSIKLPKDPHNPVHLIDYHFPVFSPDGTTQAIASVVLGIN